MCDGHIFFTKYISNAADNFRQLHGLSQAGRGASGGGSYFIIYKIVVIRYGSGEVKFFQNATVGLCHKYDYTGV